MQLFITEKFLKILEAMHISTMRSGMDHTPPH